MSSALERAQNIYPIIKWVRKVARDWYGDLLYHNWQHVLESEAMALSLWERCSRYGVDLDIGVVLLAIYGHDAYYTLDPGIMCYDLVSPSRQCVSKEEVAASVIAHTLRSRGVSESMVSMVTKCVLATHPSVLPSTPEQIVVRAADIGNIAGPYVDFARNWELLRQEGELMSGHTIDEIKWARQTTSYLSLYLWQALHLTPEYNAGSGASRFHTQAIDNIVKYITELQTRNMIETRVVVEIGPGDHPVIIDSQDIQKGDIYIGIDPIPRKVLPFALAESKAQKVPAPVFMIPGEGRCLPLTDAMADEVYLVNVACRHPEALVPTELERVLKTGGRLTVIENNYTMRWREDGPRTIEPIDETASFLGKHVAFGTRLRCVGTDVCIGEDSFSIVFVKN